MYKYLLFGGFIISSFLSFAQKKPLDHTVYDRWQSISEEKISNDGNYVAFSVLPQEGDAKLFIKNIKTNGFFNYPRANGLNFSYDNQFAAFLIKPSFKDTRMRKGQRKCPKTLWGLLRLIIVNYGKSQGLNHLNFQKKRDMLSPIF